MGGCFSFYCIWCRFVLVRCLSSSLLWCFFSRFCLLLSSALFGNKMASQTKTESGIDVWIKNGTNKHPIFCCVAVSHEIVTVAAGFCLAIALDIFSLLSTNKIWLQKSGNESFMLHIKMNCPVFSSVRRICMSLYLVPKSKFERQKERANKSDWEKKIVQNYRHSKKKCDDWTDFFSTFLCCAVQCLLLRFLQSSHSFGCSMCTMCTWRK